MTRVWPISVPIIKLNYSVLTSVCLSRMSMLVRICLVTIIVINVQLVHSQSLDAQLDSLINVGSAISMLHEDFEDLNFNDSGVCSGNCPEIIAGPNDAYMRTTLCGTMENTYRTELQIIDKADLRLEEGPYLIWFRARFNPTGPATLNKRSMFVQLHTVNTDEDLTIPRWQPLGGRVNATAGEGFWECERLDNEYYSADFEHEDGEWYEYLAYISLSQGSNGQVTCFRNGIKQFEALGANSGQWRFPLHPKFGVYSGSNQIGSANFSEGCRTIDFDDIRVIKLSSALLTDGVNCQHEYPFSVESVLNLN
ncbi:MAG: hypothetical protein ACI9YU_001571 [Flavobacteriales bacterium]|jgi:hypothetical protein